MILREEKMAEVCPVTTEGGSDLHSRNFWGMFQFYLKIKYKFNGNFSWTPKDGYDARWISMGKTIRLFPFNTGLTGDLAQIYTHNLGPAIMEMEMMADNLAMGMGLYMRYEQLPDKINGYTGLDWLKYLQYLQQEVVQYYFGQRMTGFKYVVGYDNVSRTSWLGLDLYVNHTPNPIHVQVEAKDYTLNGYEMLRMLKNQATVIPNFERWMKESSH